MALTQVRMISVIEAGESALAALDQVRELARAAWSKKGNANDTLIELCASIAAIDVSVTTRLELGVERERAKMTQKRNAKRNKRLRQLRGSFIQESSAQHPLANIPGDAAQEGESDAPDDHENVI